MQFRPKRAVGWEKHTYSGPAQVMMDWEDLHDIGLTPQTLHCVACQDEGMVISPSSGPLGWIKWQDSTTDALNKQHHHNILLGYGKPACWKFVRIDEGTGSGRGHLYFVVCRACTETFILNRDWMRGQWWSEGLSVAIRHKVVFG